MGKLKTLLYHTGTRGLGTRENRCLGVGGVCSWNFLSTFPFSKEQEFYAPITNDHRRGGSLEPNIDFAVGKGKKPLPSLHYLSISLFVIYAE